jgi:UDP:flavonoid glycosyltransferase YjiC (YdhE family)
MANVLICWELGASPGHVARQRLVAQKLRDAGHEVLFAVRDLTSAGSVLGPQGFRFVQAPFNTSRVRLARPPVNYSELLLAEGYGSPSRLLSRVQAWQALFDLFAADAIVVDHAPTALLAAHARQLPRVQIGCGFAIPPDASPFPPMRTWKGVGEAQLQRSDEMVSQSIGACLKRLPGAPLLKTVSELFREAPRCLTTFAEIDHYGERPGESYAGALFGPASGPVVRWHSKEGPRVFAYLENGALGVGNMLKSLALLPAEVICAIPGAAASAAREVSTASMRVFPHAVAYPPLLGDANLVVCHGGSGTSAQALLNGVPLLAMPASIEQLLQARRYKEMGTAVIVGATRTVDSITALLSEALSERSFAEKASDFARRHAAFRPGPVADKAAALVERAMQPSRSLPH